MSTVAWALAATLSGLYLVNPGFGIFELLPDNLPVIGNLDEGGATILFLWAMAELGFQWPAKLAGRRSGPLAHLARGPATPELN